MANKPSMLTLRLKPEQEVIIEEVSTKLNVPKSVFIRAMIGDWLTKYEDCLYRLIEDNIEENGEED